MAKTTKDSPDYKEYKKILNGDHYLTSMGTVPKNDEEYNSINYIEEHYPETAKEFQRLQFEQYALFCKKQMDYGPSNIAMGTSLDTDEEKRLSLIGLIVRINDKVQRLINLVVKNNREAQNEPTLMHSKT